MPLTAINATLSVRKDRREEFLSKLKSQISNDLQDESTSLVQFVIGEDLEKTGTFYLHLKYHCTHPDISKKEDKHFLVQKAAKDIFLGAVTDEWQKFMATDPLLVEPISHVWLVAPVKEKDRDSRTLGVATSNPKPISKRETVFCLNANLHIQPEYRDEFLEILENARQKSIEEPLCVEYQYGESVTTNNVFHVHQEYMGENGGREGFDVHAKTAHYQQYKDFAEKHKPFVMKPVGSRFRANVNTTELPKGHYKDDETSTKSTTKQDIILLDGGSGHELKERGINDGSFFAGLLANEKQADIVQAMHRDFIQSGCRVVTTNSFVAVPNRLLEEGLVTSSQEAAKERTRELIAAAVYNARTAAVGRPTVEGNQQTQQQVAKVAGTVPPLTECYIGSVVPNIENMVPTYQFIVTTLLEEKVDILLAETLSTSREAMAIVRATSLALRNNAKYSQKPLWISLTIDDFRIPTTLRSGETLEEAMCCIFEETERNNNVKLEAIGVNCASPVAVTKAIPCLVTATNRETIMPPPKILVYANAFQTTTSEWLASLTSSNDELFHKSKATFTSISGSGDYDKSGCMLPERYARHAKEWVNMGATIIGGCCGASPLHMQAVSNAILPSS